MFAPWLAALAGVVAPSVPQPGAVALSPGLVLGGCVSGGVPLRLDAGGQAIRGAVTGRIPAAEAAGPACWTGYYDRPHACIVVPDQGASITIEMTDAGGVDTTLAVVGPDGVVHCDDDGAGSLLPRISSWFDAGEYVIWGGTFSSGATASFKIEVRAEGL